VALSVQAGASSSTFGRIVGESTTGSEIDRLLAEILRLAPRTTFELPADRTTIAWTTSDGVNIGDLTCPRLTCLHSPIGEHATSEAQAPSRCSSSTPPTQRS
jgi:hypothetical protein